MIDGLVAMQQAEAGEFVQAFLAIQGLPDNRRSIFRCRLSPSPRRKRASSRKPRPSPVRSTMNQPYRERWRRFRSANCAPARARRRSPISKRRSKPLARSPTRTCRAQADRGDRRSAQAAAGLAEDANAGFEAAREVVANRSTAPEARYSTSATFALALAQSGPHARGPRSRVAHCPPGAKISALIEIAADREDAKVPGEALSSPARDSRPTTRAPINLAEFASRLPR